MHHYLRADANDDCSNTDGCGPVLECGHDVELLCGTHLRYG